LTRLAGIAGIAEEVQAWRGGGRGQLAYRRGRRWTVRPLDGTQAEALWRGLEARGAFRLATTEDAGRSAPDSVVGWTVALFQVPKQKPATPDALFAERRRVARGEVPRVRAILRWLKASYGLPRAAARTG